MNLADLERPRVDTLILADRAEVLNGKLYMMGGGWDRLTVAEFTRPHRFSIAISMIVPWNATNQEHALVIRVEGQDRQEFASWPIHFNAGRPPVVRDAESQRVVLALQAEMLLPGPGGYYVRSLVDDQSDTDIEFYVDQRPR